MTGVVTERGNLDIETHKEGRQSGNTGRGWPSVSQGEKPGTGSSPRLSKGINPADALTSDL